MWCCTEIFYVEFPLRHGDAIFFRITISIHATDVTDRTKLLSTQFFLARYTTHGVYRKPDSRLFMFGIIRGTCWPTWTRFKSKIITGFRVLLTLGPHLGPLVAQQISIEHTAHLIQSQPCCFDKIVLQPGHDIASPHSIRFLGVWNK